jgi:hypothetical protein
MNWGDAWDHRPRITVTCELCSHRFRLAARMGDPGHEPGDDVPVICPNCERTIWVHVPWSVGVGVRA